ncbi:ligand-binding sensor domain-containing protein [Williamwhitmania taraxaci]|uniref:ligand-binding sensor domain-containing protein n=1 Tax=Williamwhitmania taraxaci TaxID=1640674 RepID=UPI001480313C|nr:two-component regulator propeller domain-containing protein [Williamwhitmania taraxaci]
MAFGFAESKDSCVWLALGDGYGSGTVTFSDNIKSRVFSEADGLPNASYEQIFIASDGTVWVGGFSATKPNTAVIAKYAKNAWSVTYLNSSKENPIVKKITEPFSGQIWIATYGGIFYQKDSAWGQFSTADGLPDAKVNDILADRVGRIWIGTESGVCLFDKGDFISFEDAAVVSSVSVIFEDTRGYVWAGGKFNNDGVSVFDGVRWRTYTMEDGLAENTVGTITEDYFGRMWFGGYYDSRNGGTTMLNNGKFSRYQYPEIAKYSVDCLYGDRLGGVWCGGGLKEKSKNGLSYFRNGKWNKMGAREGLLNDRIVTVYIDKRDRVWVSTFYGLFVVNLIETINYFDAKH